MATTPSAFAEQLRARFGDGLVSLDQPRGEAGLLVEAGDWHATCAALRGWWSRFWRENTRQLGPSLRWIAARHDTADSTASHGRQTSLCGM